MNAEGTHGFPLRLCVAAGLLAGALDITFAFIFYGIHGAHPTRILQGIASGLLGPNAYDLGAWTVALGAALHFALSVCAAFVYFTIALRVPALARRPLLGGTLLGIAMYAVMHFVVIPLSRFPFHFPSVRNLIGELCSHIFLFGIVIAVFAARGHRHA